jgi:hypothetical protein
MRRRAARRSFSLLAMVLAALTIGSSLAAAGTIVAMVQPPEARPASPTPITSAATAAPARSAEPPREEPRAKTRVSFGSFEGY